MSRNELRPHLPWWRYPVAPFPQVNLDYTRLKGKKRAIYPVKDDFTKAECAAYVVQPWAGHYDIVEFQRKEKKRGRVVFTEKVVEKKTVTKWSRMSLWQRLTTVASLEMRPWSFDYHRYTELITIGTGVWSYVPAHYEARSHHQYVNIDRLIVASEKRSLLAKPPVTGETYYSLDHFKWLTARQGAIQSNLGRDNPPLIFSGDGWKRIPRTILGYALNAPRERIRQTAPHPGIVNNVCVDGPPRQANWQHRPRLLWRKPVPSNDWRWKQSYRDRVPPMNARISRGSVRLLPADDTTGCFKLVGPGHVMGIFMSADWKLNSDGTWLRVDGGWTFVPSKREDREVPPSFKPRNAPRITPLPAWRDRLRMFAPYPPGKGAGPVAGLPVLCPVKVNRHYYIGAWEQLRLCHRPGVPVPLTTDPRLFMADRRYFPYKMD